MKRLLRLAIVIGIASGLAIEFAANVVSAQNRPPTSWVASAGAQFPTATIAINTSLSAAVNLQSYRMFAVQMPAAWTTANLTFQASADCNTYANVYNDAGTEMTVTAAAAEFIVMSTPAQWIAIGPCIKIRSGTSGSAVNQTAARTITIIAVP